MISQRRSINLKEYIYKGDVDNLRVKVDNIRMIKLKLATRYELKLHNVSYVLLIRRNLLSVSFLDKQGYNFYFGNGQVKFYHGDNIVGFGTLCDNLYQVDLFCTYFNSSLNVVVAPPPTTSKCA